MTRQCTLLILLGALMAIVGCGGSQHHGSPAGPTAPAAPTGTGSGQETAALFAAAYVRFLDGAGTAGALPDATPAVRRLADQAGAVPAGRRRGTLVLAQLRPAQGPGGNYFVAARDQAHTFYAQITLGQEHGRWVVVQLTPPDFVQTLAPAGPAAPMPPRASAAAETAAQRFLQGYLPWLYGHAPATTAHDGTPGLLAELKRHPPRIPPAMRSLHATVAAIAMQHHAGGWQALANITDGRQTYELVLTLTRTRGRWLVSRVGNPR
jgi:hypothetical protein